MPAIIHRPGEGECLGLGPSSVTILASGADTAEACFVSETRLEPGFSGPPLHRHEHLHDMFYVLEGSLTVHVDGQTHAAGPGTFVCVPPGVVHAFANETSEPVRFLNINTPAGWEAYMRDLAAASEADGTLTSERIGEIASRYDFVLAS